MSISEYISKHVKEVFFGGNWTASDLKKHLDDVSWTEATTQVYDLNTIATLTHHIHYYIVAVTNVLEGNPLNAKDELSFDHKPINSAEDWNTILNRIWRDADKFVDLIQNLPEEKLWQDFTDPKYGIYYSNLHGIIEHTHYHLGQIVLIKKIIRQ